jgi:hypothetical protein
MPRCSKRNNRHQPSCTCLVDAFRTFQAQAEPAPGCGSPECPVKSLDSLTLQRFLQVIGGPDGQGEEIGGAGDGKDLPMFRAVVRRRNR